MTEYIIIPVVRLTQQLCVQLWHRQDSRCTERSIDRARDTFRPLNVAFIIYFDYAPYVSSCVGLFLQRTEPSRVERYSNHVREIRGEPRPN